MMLGAVPVLRFYKRKRLCDVFVMFNHSTILTVSVPVLVAHASVVVTNPTQ